MENDSSQTSTPQRLNTLRLAALTFFTVSGGPFGLEGLISAGGPFASWLALLLVPWVWGMPMALMTAELSSAIPEMGGYIVWVRRAFGDFWAFQNALWNVATNFLDNALYPVLFLDYVEDMVGAELGALQRWLVAACVVLLISAINVRGVDFVGDGAGVFGVLVLMPFVALVIGGVAKGGVHPSAWLAGPPADAKLGQFATILLWNTCGYDSAGTCAAEVDDPGRTYVHAMLITIAASTVVYVAPILVGVCYASDLAEWRDGYFVTVGDKSLGQWLAVWITIAGTFSAVGLLNSTMCTTSRALASVASYGFAPAPLASLHPMYNTPYNAVLVNAVVVLGLVATGWEFERIAEASMWLYALTVGFEFAALVQLRLSEPGLPRPFRIPLGFRMLILFFALPISCCLALMALSTPLTWAICGGVLVCGFSAWLPYRYVNCDAIAACCPATLPWPLHSGRRAGIVASRATYGRLPMSSRSTSDDGDASAGEADVASLVVELPERCSGGAEKQLVAD